MKILCFFVVTLACLNTLLFNVISPLFWYFDVERATDEQSEQYYAVFILHLNWGMQLADFLCCMTILYLIH